jgi:hypothetical protein
MSEEAEPKYYAVLVVEFFLGLHDGLHVGSPHSHKQGVNPLPILEGNKLLGGQRHFDRIGRRRELGESVADGIAGLLHFLISGGRRV